MHQRRLRCVFKPRKRDITTWSLFSCSQPFVSIRPLFRNTISLRARPVRWILESKTGPVDP